jgi:hypothetical protein
MVDDAIPRSRPHTSSTTNGGNRSQSRTAQQAVAAVGRIFSNPSPAAVVARCAKPTLASIVRLPLASPSGERVSLMLMRPRVKQIPLS